MRTPTEIRARMNNLQFHIANARIYGGDVAAYRKGFELLKWTLETEKKPQQYDISSVARCPNCGDECRRNEKMGLRNTFDCLTCNIRFEAVIVQDLAPKPKRVSLRDRIEKARAREDRDDHLTTEERAMLVAKYKEEHPSEQLPSNTDDAFVIIIYGR